MSIVSPRGLRVQAAGPQHTPLNSAQVRRRRNEFWRRDHDEGTIDPVTGRRLTLTVEMISAMTAHDPSTVKRGIASARRLRRAIAHATA